MSRAWSADALRWNCRQNWQNWESLTRRFRDPQAAQCIGRGSIRKSRSVAATRRFSSPSRPARTRPRTRTTRHSAETCQRQSRRWCSGKPRVCSELTTGCEICGIKRRLPPKRETSGLEQRNEDRIIRPSFLLRIGSGGRLRLPLWGYCPACRLERMVESVGDEPGRDQDHAEGERTHPEDGLMLAAEYGETEQEHRRDADRDRPEQATRDLEWTLQRRLAETEDRQRYELKE